MVRRGQVDREHYWRGLIEDQKGSGLSISAFCRQREVPAGSFFNWRRKLVERERSLEAAGSAKFVPIELSAPPARQAGCEVVLPDGCRIIVPPQCAAGWLREIFMALRERPC